MIQDSSIPIFIIILSLTRASLTLPIAKREVTYSQYLCTNLKVSAPDENIFNWQVKNAKSLLEKTADYVWSPTFYSRNYTDTWQMQLQPMTELSPDFIGIYLHLISSKMYGMQIQLKFDLTTMDMKKIRSIDPLVHKFDGPNSIGFPSVDLRSNVLTGLGTEEDLMISCSLTVTANATMTPCDEIETSPESSSEPLKEEESNNFRHLYLNSDQSDVTIVIENETIPAHKFILSARCPIFADIFEAAGGIDINSLVIEGMDLAEVKGLLEFIYKDEVSNLEELAEGLLRAADAYELPKLRTLCEGIMYDRLTETSAAQLLILAHVCHADDLKTKVLVFIADHLNGVAASEGYKDIVLYPELLDEIIRSTAQKNSSEGSIESVGETLIKDSGGRMQTTTHVTL